MHAQIFTFNNFQNEVTKYCHEWDNELYAFNILISQSQYVLERDKLNHSNILQIFHLTTLERKLHFTHKETLHYISPSSMLHDRCAQTHFINKIYQLITVITITYSDYKPQISNDIKHFF